MHLFVTGVVYLLGLVCFFGYIMQKIGWRRGKSLNKIKLTVFYMVWVWSILCSAIVNWAEGFPLGMMLIWGVFFVFVAWFIKEGLFRIASSIRHRRICRFRRR